MKTIRERFLEQKAAGYRFATLTAYDYPTARLFSESALDFLLVGDSLGMVILGQPDTTDVTLQDILHHTKAVVRGAGEKLVVSDLPLGTIETSEAALANARRLLEAGAGAVKLEGGAEIAPIVHALTEANIPVVGHIGMLPQRVKEEGGYKIKGKTAEEAEQLLNDAKALSDAGATSIVLELVSPPLAAEISRSIPIPTIGIGSGPDCDGQILVMHDLLGLSPWFRPKFVTPKRNLAAEIQAAVQEFVDDVRPAQN